MKRKEFKLTPYVAPIIEVYGLIAEPVLAALSTNHEAQVEDEYEDEDDDEDAPFTF